MLAGDTLPYVTPPPPAPLAWRTLVLIYPVLDARIGSGLARRRARRVVARDEREAIHAILERLPDTVMDWTSGLATLEPFDIIEIRRPMGSMSSTGGGRWWVGPREVRPALADVAAEGGRYDSVFALWPGDPDSPISPARGEHRGEHLDEIEAALRART